MTSEGYVYCQGAASLLSVGCKTANFSPTHISIYIYIYINIYINIYIRFTLGLGLVIVWLTIGLPLVIGWLTGSTQKGRFILNRPCFRLFSL